MEFGVHLPQIGRDQSSFSLADLIEYAETAEQLGYRYLCANDHLLFSRPWIDGPTALAALVSDTSIPLATTISLPVVRGPVRLAKTLGAIDLLSDGRLIAGVGPGSSEQDFEAVGIPFEERWPRFDESIRTLRALWDPEQTFDGEFYSTEDIALEPFPAQEDGPPIWIGSWGSEVGLRRVARLGDGWLASGYNTTPEQFEAGRLLLEKALSEEGKNPHEFPNAIATMFFYVAEEDDEGMQVISDILAPMLNRTPDELVESLPVGSPETCADILAAYRAAGVQRVYLWPIVDEIDQLQMLHDQVLQPLDQRA